MPTATIQVRRRGTITLPRELRQRYQLGEGDVFTVTDLGNGALLLTPHVSHVAHYGDQVAKVLAEGGVTVDEMLQALDKEREAYYRERYQSPSEGPDAPSAGRPEP